ncbi:MAG: response regulator [Leptolyngbyaceae bacterium]|nr:response regulator [Leptolyngbyaceae bacterium]
MDNLSKRQNNEAQVLIVEDDPHNRDMMLRMLHFMGHSADAARNGEEALDLLELKNYVLVITDLRMPRMGGIKLAQNIRQHSKKEIREVRIIGLSACVMWEEKVEFWQAGINDLLEKPVRMQALSSFIDKNLECLSKKLNLIET